MLTSLNAIITVVTAIFNQIGDIISTVLSTIQNIINIGLSFIKVIWDNTLNGIVSVVTGFGETIKNAFEGIIAFGKEVIENGINTIKGFFSNLGDIDLLGAGKAIIEGFLKGLKAAYEKVKEFVGGIADWIKEHKGPLPYDKRLLIPAGKAIMDGLNQGLENSFKNVQKNVSNMADRLASEMDFGNSSLAIQGASYSELMVPKLSAESALGIGQR